MDGGAQLQTQLRGQAMVRPKQKPTSSWQTLQKHPSADTNLLGPVLAFRQQTYLPRHLGPLASDEHILSSYLAASLGQLGALYEKIAAPGFEQDSTPWAVTRQCFLALATTVYGVGHSHEHITDSGRRLYGQSLHLLNTTMKRSYPRDAMAHVLSSVVALTLHEVGNPFFPHSVLLTHRC